MRASPDLHDYDIKKWRPAFPEYTTYLTDRKNSPFKDCAVSTLVLEEWKTRELYALITSALGIGPNGMMTKLIRSKPMNNLWWWDFVISDGHTLLNILCSNSKVEIHSYSNVKGFDIREFLVVNMKLHSSHINAMIGMFEVHDAYINHYLSYGRVTQYLESEIKALDLSKPSIMAGGVIGDTDSATLVEEMERYSRNSIKFHALGKSLVLNSAFMAESYLSLITRIGEQIVTREDEKKLKEFSNRNFEYRLKHLHQFSSIFDKEIDTSVAEIQDMLKVMSLRNKYAHNDLSSDFNKLEPVYFDDDYPLLDSPNHNFIVDTVELSFHNPSRETVLNCYETSKNFVSYLRSLMDPRMISFVNEIQDLSVITQNRKTRNHSVIFRSDSSIGLLAGGK